MNLETKALELLSEYGLDFRIEKLPLSGMLEVKDDNNTVMGIDNVPSSYYGLYNTKTKEIINTVKDSYHISQNMDIMMSVLRGTQKFGNLDIIDAKSFNGGRRTMIKLGIEGDSIVGDDVIKKNITIIDSNDGSSSLLVGIGDFTMSCKNQFYQFPIDGRMRARHTKTIDSKVAQIEFLIAHQLELFMQQINLYRDFQSTKVSRNLAHKMVNSLLGIDKTMKLDDISSRKVNAMESLYGNIHREMNTKGNNLWGLHSGVTRWTTHDKSAPRRNNGRLESLMVGTNYKTNQSSIEFAKKQLLILG